MKEVGDANWPDDWEDYGPLSDLGSIGAFRIDAARLRKVNTKYGENISIDLAVSHPSMGEGNRFYSGFSAGISQMILQAQPRDFPVWVSIEQKETKNGMTTVLAPASEEDATEDGIPF
jgi:hypothetical protein